MVFTFPKFTLDVDVEKTQAYYNTAKTVSEECDCNGCRNYEQAVNYLPREVTLFFTQLGVDMKKFREVFACSHENDTVSYLGITHVCGRVISGESNAWVSSSDSWDSEKRYFLTDDFSVSYSEGCCLLDDSFPRPAIQLEISAVMPWFLAE